MAAWSAIFLASGVRAFSILGNHQEGVLDPLRGAKIVESAALAATSVLRIMYFSFLINLTVENSVQNFACVEMIPFMKRNTSSRVTELENLYLWVYGSFFCMLLGCYIARLRVHEARLHTAHIAFSYHYFFRILRSLSALVASVYTCALFLFFVVQASPSFVAATNYVLVDLSRYCQLIANILLLLIVACRAHSYTIVSPYGSVPNRSLHRPGLPGAADSSSRHSLAASSTASSELENGGQRRLTIEMLANEVRPEIADTAVSTLFAVSALFGIVTSIPSVTVASMYTALVGYSTLSRLVEIIAVGLCLGGVKISGESRRRLLTRLQEMSSIHDEILISDAEEADESPRTHNPMDETRSARSELSSLVLPMPHSSSGVSSSTNSSVASSQLSSLEQDTHSNIIKTRSVEV